MSSYRSRGGYSQHSYRPSFYDDRSRSRSPRRRSPPYDGPRGRNSPSNYRDRSLDRRYESRSRSRQRRTSRSRSRDPRPASRGRPSREIMMEDLASHVTENDIQYELQHHYRVGQIDDVRIIRDRHTRQSKGFGFLRFPTIEDAEAFMDANYPTIYIYGESSKGDSSDDAKVRIAYGRERRDVEKSQENDWICKICNINNFSTRSRCFRCQTLRPDALAPQKAKNVGDNDASTDNVPSQYLLLRGLESSVSEELLAKGVAKLNKPSSNSTIQPSQPSAKKAKVASTTGDSNLGAKDGTLRRILLVRDRRTNESWRYGFAEYASIEDAQAALVRYKSFDRFTIASKHVLVSYIHAGVFIPVQNPSAANERFTFSSIGNTSVKLAYWDDEAYVTELVLNAPEPVQTANSKESAAAQAEKEGFKGTQEAEKAKKRKAQTDAAATVGTTSNTKKVTPSHLQFWSNRHAELHGIQQAKSDGAPGSEASRDASPNGSNSGAPPARSYADLQRNCCYLCMRQFSSTAETNKHERLSDLHRQNLKDEIKVQKAQHKLEKHGVAQTAPPTSAVEYRDRAKERRKIYGVVNKKGEQISSTPSAAAKDLASKDDDDNEADEDSHTTSSAAPPSKGASLLSKMGYTAGRGLGAQGGGIQAPISQDVYVAGVGLGAQGGKVGDAVAEAERNTKGDYGAFAEQTREKARERYSRM